MAGPPPSMKYTSGGARVRGHSSDGCPLGAMSSSLEGNGWFWPVKKGALIRRKRTRNKRIRQGESGGRLEVRRPIIPRVSFLVTTVLSRQR